jgi:hypothetical protein
MKSHKYRIKGRVWIYEGSSPWHFITINKQTAGEIKKEYRWPRRGFGAIPVEVELGSTRWVTSIFPEKGGSYFLPLKKEVRATENIKAGDIVRVRIEVIS